MNLRSVVAGRETYYVGISDTVRDVAQYMSDRRVGAVTVLDGQRVAGILSERDIVRVLSERGPNVLQENVATVMTRKVMTCTETDTVVAIMERMTAGKFRHLPVVDQGRLVGVISIGDVVKSRVEEFEGETEALREYIATA